MRDVIAEEIGTILRGYLSEAERVLQVPLEQSPMTDERRAILTRTKILAEDLLEIFY